MIKPQDLMALADRLAAVQKEPEGRAAVSRAYYSAFHVAKSLLEQDCGVVLPKGPESHRKLQSCLQESQNIGLAEVGNRLESLREERNRADYRLDDSKFSKPPNVELQLKVAAAVVDDLTAAKNRAPEFKLRIRTYASNVLKLILKEEN